MGRRYRRLHHRSTNREEISINLCTIVIIIREFTENGYILFNRVCCAGGTRTERVFDLSIHTAQDLDVPRETALSELSHADLSALVEQLRFITDSAPLLISYIDADLRYRMVNRHYADWFKRSNDQILGRHASEVIGEVAFVQIRSRLETVLGGGIVSYEAQMPYDAGHRYVRIELVPDKAPSGQIRGMVAVVLDITEHHQAEERDRFLANLFARTSLLADPGMVLQETVQSVGLFLNLSRYMYADIDEQAGTVTVHHDFCQGDTVSSVAGVWPLAAWGEVIRDLAAGRTVVNRDYRTDPRTAQDWEAIYQATDIRANVTVPLHRDGKWVGVFSAQMTGEPRDWQPEEVLLLEEIAQRMWLILENARLRQAEEVSHLRQRRFLRDLLFSLTAGKLTLCDSEKDLPTPLAAVLETIELSRPSLRSFRQQIEIANEVVQIPVERGQDLVTGASEGAMNAVVHAGGGTGYVRTDEERGVVQVWVQDTGTGISEEALPRALEKGASTAGTLGHGFWMILHTCDRVWLLTGTSGTTIVMEQDRTPPEPDWMREIDLGM